MARLSASLGRDHVVTAESALRLAALLVDRDAERARSLAIDARATLARSYGAEHPAVGRAWWLEARAEAALGADPLPAALAAEELGREHVRRIAVGLSERDLLQYLEVRPRGVDLALETILREAASPARVGRTRQVWQEVARSRALVFDTLSERRQFLAASDQSELSRARQALAHVLVSSVGDREAEYSERLHAARERVEREERALSLGKPSRSTEPPDSGALDLRRVLARLTADEALLAYRIFDARDGPRLAAFFATGTAQTPTVVDLGPWRAIEHELRRWRDAFRSASEEEYRRAAVSLREKLWDPVEPQLRARRCIVVPDGPLFLLPFAALPIDNGYLVERGPTFHYLGAERDLLESVPQSFAAGRVVIVGGPEFGEPDASSSANSALGRFEPLPGALQEASLVAEAWERWIPGSRVERYDGAVATEQIWRRKAPGAVALHLATHGFVLGGAFSSPSVEPAPAPTPVRYRGVGGLAARVEAAEFEPLLAGFALAGANRALTGLAPDATAVATDGTADGIVTLEEIRQLNLHGTQLMVLSFCDSGTGQTLDGEGIFGFTRTFRSAGVRSMVLALAPISDRDSLRFMGHFYSGLLGEGTAVDKALQRASLLLLSELREAQGDTHPRRWGAMVSTGARLHRPSESVRASP
jgi:CHAT domain-containing protein